MTVPEALGDMFDKPGSIESFKPADHQDCLLLIWAHNVKPYTEDDGTVKDVTECNIVVLDAPGGPAEFVGVNLFQKYLQARVRRNVGTGRANLGRLTQRPPTNPKHSKAWDLADPTEADIAMAREYMAHQATQDHKHGVPAPAGSPTVSRTPAVTGGVPGMPNDKEPPF